MIVRLEAIWLSSRNGFCNSEIAASIRSRSASRSSWRASRWVRVAFVMALPAAASHNQVSSVPDVMTISENITFAAEQENDNRSCSIRLTFSEEDLSPIVKLTSPDSDIASVNGRRLPFHGYARI